MNAQFTIHNTDNLTSRTNFSFKSYNLKLPCYSIASSKVNRNKVFLTTFSTEVQNQLFEFETTTKEGGQNGIQVNLKTSVDSALPSSKVLVGETTVGSQSDPETNTEETVITSSDKIHIYRCSTLSSTPKLTPVATLTNREGSKLAPITSFDLRPFHPTQLLSGSVDTTCTLWDINTSRKVTQLIAHDREVFDTKFIPEPSGNLFVTGGADGSVRIFDLRALHHSTVLFESSSHDTNGGFSNPILRVSGNLNDTRYLTCTQLDSHIMPILDIRRPSIPVAQLSDKNHFPLEVEWLPNNKNQLLSVGSEGNLLRWDLSKGIGDVNINALTVSPDLTVRPEKCATNLKVRPSDNLARPTNREVLVTTTDSLAVIQL